MKWNTDLPDSEITVLMRLNDSEYPIWPGFHEGDEWHSCDGSSVEGPVFGWAHLEDAAIALDQISRGNSRSGDGFTQPKGARNPK